MAFLVLLTIVVIPLIAFAVGPLLMDIWLRGNLPPDAWSLHNLATDAFDWEWIAAFLAVVSLAVAVGMAYWQYRTEKNTMKITPEGQVGLLMDFIRHFYANLLVTQALKCKLAGKYESHYPSEEHLRKLAVDTEALHPDAFYSMKEKYNSIHELLLLIRNYNIEVGTAENHLCSPTIPVRFKERDFSTLVFKPGLIAQKAYGCICVINNTDSDIRTLSAIKEVLINHAIGRNEAPKAIKEKCKPLRAELKEIDRQLLRLQTFGGNRKCKIRAEKDLLEKAKRIKNDIFAIKKEFIENNDNYAYALEKIGMTEDELAGICGEFACLFFNGDEKTFYHLLAANIYNEMIKTDSHGFDVLSIIPFP